MPRIAHVLVVVLVIGLGPTSSGAQTLTGFQQGERRTGSTTQCIYSVAGAEYTETVTAEALCPMTIRVPVLSSATRVQTPSARPRNEWEALGQGLKGLGAHLAADRERDRQEEAAQETAARMESVLNAQALLAKAEQIRMINENQMAYLQPIEDLFSRAMNREYLTTEESKGASGRYAEILQKDGKEAAARFWVGEVHVYTLRRRINVPPRDFAALVLQQALWEEYEATREYRLASERRDAIREAQGSEAAGQFWSGVQSEALKYVEQRWAGTIPR